MAAPSFRDAVRARDDGVLLDLDVTPGARSEAFPSGFDPWRRRIGIRVRAPAHDGKANAAVCTLVAATLGVPSGAVTVASGPTSGLKTLVVAGTDVAAVLVRLEALLA